MIKQLGFGWWLIQKFKVKGRQLLFYSFTRPNSTGNYAVKNLYILLKIIGDWKNKE